jgi:chitosanase
VFLDVRRAAMKRERSHHDTSRIDDEQRVFLRRHNFALRPPLVWHTYGDRYEIR